MAESGRVINSEVKHCMDEKKVPSYPQQMVVNVELIEAVLNVINEETARICNERNASTTS